MVGGTIIETLVTAPGEGSQEIMFLVKGTGSESKDFCCVKAIIPNSALEEIKPGKGVWWQDGLVYLHIFNESDVPFRKVGFSGGTVKDFYKEYADLLSF